LPASAISEYGQLLLSAYCVEKLEIASETIFRQTQVWSRI
jgi:hypothetical protein